MGMSRCYSLMKCLLILFNIIFLMVGGGACGLAGWALWDGRAGAGETPQGRAALCALGAWGAALALGALAALAGAIRQSASLLAAAFALLALTGVAEGAAAWWGAAHLPQLRAALADRLLHTVRHDYGRVHSRTQLLDVIQEQLECCGSESTRDWQSSWWSRSQAAGDGDGEGEGALAAEGAVEASGVEGGQIAAAARNTLDLSVSAPTTYYHVPASCCATRDPHACSAAALVPAASRGAGGLHGAGCGPRVLAALERAARVPLAVGAALLAAHATTLLLALALCLRAQPDNRYKA